MSKTKFTVVMPSYRQDQFDLFMKAWSPLFYKHNVTLIVVWDGDKNPLLLAGVNDHYTNIYFYNHTDIDAELGPNAWIIPRRTDCIRSFGFYKAWQSDCDYIITLDDDVRPIEGFDIFEAYEKQFREGAIVSDYFDVGSLLERPAGLQMRGFPFSERQKKTVMLQYGMWAGVPDLDGITQLANPTQNGKVIARNVVIPRGTAVTGCIMNCAFRREFAPNMYQLLMGKDWPFDRWGDIWSGLIAKRVCDINDWAVVINGWATVEHIRASDVNTNIKKEASGYAVNEELWDNMSFDAGDTSPELLLSMAQKDYFYNKDYSNKLLEASILWTKLFSKL